MSEVSNRIAAAKAEIEETFGLELSVIQAQKAETGYSICKHKAISQLEQEIIATINAQVLTQWLIDNEIPEEYYEDYAYFGDTLYYRGEAVEDE